MTELESKGILRRLGQGEPIERIFVGARLRLRGPAGVVQPWPNHDDHLHVRLRRSAR